jgi:cytochrome c biogenesis protein CcdA
MLPLVVSLGLADSVNPVTIVVGLYLASTPHPVRRLVGYTAGVFAIYLAGALVLLLGPASLLRLVTHGVDPSVGRVLAIVIGVAAIVVAVVVWRRRKQVSATALPDRALKPGSTLALGAGLTVVDLPTAFPLFIVVGAIVNEDLSVPVEIGLMAVYCLAYVLPLIAITVVRAAGGERAERWLENLRERSAQWAPIALSALTLLVGIALIVYGIVV